MSKPMFPPGAIRFIQSGLQPDGTHTLMKGDLPLWTGPLGDPIEDVDYDTVILSPADYRRLAG